MSTEKQQTDKSSMILGTIGALGGLYYAFSKGKGFWGYIGYFFLGSIAGTLVGNLVAQNKKPSSSVSPQLNTSPITSKQSASEPQSSTPNTQPILMSNTEATNTSVKNFMDFDGELELNKNNV